MQKTIAYVRISDTQKQDPATQKSRITDYAVERKIIISRWVESHMSGSKTSREERGISELLTMLGQGDHLIVSDVARLGRTTLSDIIEIVTRFINNGVTLHFAYSSQQISPDDTNDIAKIFIALGEAFAAVKFAEERAQKAKAAIARRKMSGLANGRKHGAIVKSKLDKHELTIINLSSQNYSEYDIAKHLRLDRITLRRWKERREQLITMAKSLNIWKPDMTIIDIKAALKSA